MTRRVETTDATIVFVDLAGFSAIADVYGDAAAVRVLDQFEAMVHAALDGLGSPLKWIGDEVMLAFPAPDDALKSLAKLLPACRETPELPLTRTSLHHGPVIRRGDDLFGSTVNIAARIAALAAPGQLLGTQSVAAPASAAGIDVRDLGEAQLRSLATPTRLFSIELASAADPAWIDPVCKMHAPYGAFKRKPPTGPWFCSPKCAEAYQLAPHAYKLKR